MAKGLKVPEMPEIMTILITISCIAYAVSRLVKAERAYWQKCGCEREIIDMRRRRGDDTMLIVVFIFLQILLSISALAIWHQGGHNHTVSGDILLWVTIICMDLVLLSNARCAFRRLIAGMRLRGDQVYCKVQKGEVQDCPHRQVG